MAAALDDIDRRIVDALVHDGRMTMRSLSEHVHVSRANAYARMDRLRDAGVITGFSATLNPVAMGQATSAYVTMSLRQTGWRDIRDRLQAMPSVVHIALVGGEFDVIALIRATDNEDLRRIVLDDIQSIPGVLTTRTALVFEEVRGP